MRRVIVRTVYALWFLFFVGTWGMALFQLADIINHIGV